MAALLAPQRWFNARINDVDHALRTGPKGTMLVDKATLDRSKMTLAEFNEATTRGDATIALDKGPGQWDEVIMHLQQSPLPAGTFDFLGLIPQLMERIDGITEAAMGRDIGASTATEYERSNLQSNVATFIYHDSYFEALNRKDRKEVRLLQQVLDQPTVFRDLKTDAVVPYDPARARALRFDVAMGAAANTPTERLAREAKLLRFVEMGVLPFEVYLQHSGEPDAHALLRDFQAYQQQQALAQLAALDAADKAGLIPPPDQKKAA
jgi:hypothetical protein